MIPLPLDLAWVAYETLRRQIYDDRIATMPDRKLERDLRSYIRTLEAQLAPLLVHEVEPAVQERLA